MPGEILFNICEYLDTYQDVDNFLTYVQFEWMGNLTWHHLLLSKLQVQWERGWDKITISLMDTIRNHKLSYWAHGYYCQTQLESELTQVFDNLLQFNHETNKIVASLFSQVDQNRKKDRCPNILTINMKVAPDYSRRDQRLEICIHLPQMHNLFKTKSSHFTIARSEFFHTNIRCQVVEPELHPNISRTTCESSNLVRCLHIGGPCKFCNRRLLKHQQGFYFRVGTGAGDNVKQFVKVSTKAQADDMLQELQMDQDK